MAFSINAFSKSVSNDVKQSIDDSLAERKISAVINKAMFGANKRRLYFTDLRLPKDRRKGFSDVELWIDPQNMGIVKNNIINKTLTKNGFVIQHWGHDLPVLSVGAVSGFFGMTKGLTDIIVKDLGDIRYKRGGPLSAFTRLKDYAFNERYDKNKRHIGQPVITLVYEGSAYDGYFNNFNYNLVSTNPFQITYNFSFTMVEPDEDKMDVFKGSFWSNLDIVKTIKNPAGTISDITNATINSSQKHLENLLNKVSDLIPVKGLQKILDSQPSKVTLY